MVDWHVHLAQLQWVNQVKRSDRQGQVILLDDNTRPRAVNIVKAALLDLEWEVLLHPLYCMDYARTGFQLFRVLGNHLRNRSTTPNIVGEFLRDDTHCFMEIQQIYLLERWEKVMDSDKGHITQYLIITGIKDVVFYFRGMRNFIQSNMWIMMEYLTNLSTVYSNIGKNVLPPNDEWFSFQNFKVRGVCPWILPASMTNYRKITYF